MRREVTPATLLVALLLGAASMLNVSSDIMDALTGAAVAVAVMQ